MLSFLAYVVKVEVKTRVVTVTGPRGVLTRDFKHVNFDMLLVGDKIRVDLWFGNRKQLACLRTICSHIENMITGVTRGYVYKMRFVYAHFPINVTVQNAVVEIRNFLGQKRVFRVPVPAGVTAVRSTSVKDELVLTGNDIAIVSNVASNIYSATRVKNKDIRKFLDGIYVSESGPTPVA